MGFGKVASQVTNGVRGIARAATNGGSEVVGRMKAVAIGVKKTARSQEKAKLKGIEAKLTSAQDNDPKKTEYQTEYDEQLGVTKKMYTEKHKELTPEKLSVHKTDYISLNGNPQNYANVLSALKEHVKTEKPYDNFEHQISERGLQYLKDNLNEPCGNHQGVRDKIFGSDANHSVPDSELNKVWTLINHLHTKKVGKKRADFNTAIDALKEISAENNLDSQKEQFQKAVDARKAIKRSDGNKDFTITNTQNALINAANSVLVQNLLSKSRVFSFQMPKEGTQTGLDKAVGEFNRAKNAIVPSAPLGRSIPKEVAENDEKEIQRQRQQQQQQQQQQQVGVANSSVAVQQGAEAVDGEIFFDSLSELSSEPASATVPEQGGAARSKNPFDDVNMTDDDFNNLRKNVPANVSTTFSPTMGQTARQATAVSANPTLSPSKQPTSVSTTPTANPTIAPVQIPAPSTAVQQQPADASQQAVSAAPATPTAAAAAAAAAKGFFVQNPFTSPTASVPAPQQQPQPQPTNKEGTDQNQSSAPANQPTTDKPAPTSTEAQPQTLGRQLTSLGYQVIDVVKKGLESVANTLGTGAFGVIAVGGAVEIARVVGNAANNIMRHGEQYVENNKDKT